MPPYPTRRRPMGQPNRIDYGWQTPGIATGANPPFGTAPVQTPGWGDAVKPPWQGKSIFPPTGGEEPAPPGMPNQIDWRARADPNYGSVSTPFPGSQSGTPNLIDFEAGSQLGGGYQATVGGSGNTAVFPGAGAFGAGPYGGGVVPGATGANQLQDNFIRTLPQGQQMPLRQLINQGVPFDQAYRMTMPRKV